ncbi:MAG: AAA family ATPase [Methanomicrobiaceae archaeon]|nr:AAA family ATPase [Methanomicrobiaceae archaeon]
MRFTEICAENFRSFDKLHMELGGFNVLIGPNAAGKSNFIGSIRYLRDIASRGLENAISLQGGVEYLRNVCIGGSRDQSASCIIDATTSPITLQFCEEDGARIVAHCFRIAYRLTIRFPSADGGYTVSAERLKVSCSFSRITNGADEVHLGGGHVALDREGDHIRASVIPETVAGLFRLPSYAEPFSPKRSLLENPTLFPLLSPVVYGTADFFRSVALYDFDPKLSKRATPVAGRSDLEPDAGNLAIVLRRILANPEKKEMLTEFAAELFPFIEEFRVEQMADSTLVTTIRERYTGSAVIPAPLISDGTINLTALIVALYFENKPVIVLEEPERNIHPFLISKIIDMMKEVPERIGTQLIITTHNPEFVKNAGAENLFLISRDERGFSKIARPAESEELRIFLATMGIEELYVQNLL